MTKMKKRKNIIVDFFGDSVELMPKKWLDKLIGSEIIDIDNSRIYIKTRDGRMITIWPTLFNGPEDSFSLFEFTNWHCDEDT